MKVLSLFDGISCGKIALDRLNIKVDKYIAYEVDENAIKISQKNHDDIIYAGDVFKGDFTKYKGFDLLIGGSPCTFWSINKKDREISSEGFGYELFSQYVRALKESGCKYFLYENNHKMHDDIKTAITKDLGVEPILIDSSLVSAQKRMRLYWTNIPFVSQPEDKNIHVKDILDIAANEIEKDYSDAVVFKDKYSHEPINKTERVGNIGKGGQAQRVYNINGKSVTLTANSGGMGAKTGLYLIDGKVRKLTPLEAERLQTLPDNYTNVEGVSETHRYKGIGNGWTVDIIAYILQGLKEV